MKLVRCEMDFIEPWKYSNSQKSARDHKYENCITGPWFTSKQASQPAWNVQVMLKWQTEVGYECHVSFWLSRWISGDNEINLDGDQLILFQHITTYFSLEYAIKCMLTLQLCHCASCSTRTKVTYTSILWIHNEYISTVYRIFEYRSPDMMPNLPQPRSQCLKLLGPMFTGINFANG